jgi:hypothetical protein
MDADRHIWQIWARKLHQWGLGEGVATVLESAGPLTYLGAQALYLVQPWMNRLLPAGYMDALVDIFEDHAKTSLFATILREGKTQ